MFKSDNKRVISTFRDGIAVSFVGFLLLLILDKIIFSQSNVGGFDFILWEVVIIPVIQLIFIVVKNIIKVNNFGDFVFRILVSLLWLAIANLLFISLIHKLQLY